MEYTTKERIDYILEDSSKSDTYKIKSIKLWLTDGFIVDKDKVKNLYYNALGQLKIYQSSMYNNNILAAAEA